LISENGIENYKNIFILQFILPACVNYWHPPNKKNDWAWHKADVYITDNLSHTYLHNIIIKEALLRIVQHCSESTSE